MSANGTLSSRCLEAPQPLTPSEGRATPHTRSILRAPFNRAAARGTGMAARQPYDEISLGTLKSGKEAEVFLLERRYAGGSTVLLAHKRYRPRRPARGELRELGFKKATSYRHDSTYRCGWFLSSRDRRAVAHKTDHGHEVIERMWPIQEMAMLELAWASGAAVPYPVERSEDGVVMEFIGDADAAAPRLAQAHLSRSEVASAWQSAAGQPAGHDLRWRSSTRTCPPTTCCGGATA